MEAVVETAEEPQGSREGTQRELLIALLARIEQRARDMEDRGASPAVSVAGVLTDEVLSRVMRRSGASSESSLSDGEMAALRDIAAEALGEELSSLPKGQVSDGALKRRKKQWSGSKGRPVRRLAAVDVADARPPDRL